MSHVVVTRALPIDLRALLPADVEVWAREQGPMPRAELAAQLATADALICLLSDRIDSALLDGAPRLRIVANYAVGRDNVDVAAATRRGILVTNTPDVLTEATADLAFALLLCAARRLAEGDALVRGGRWRGWEPRLLLGAEVFGRTLGVVGLGRIGRAVARRARGFDMRVVYYAPRRALADVEAALGASWRPLDALLGEADFVSLHCPLTAETRGLLGERELRLTKPGSVLVNTARGALVNEPALAQALVEGRLGGAGLDVFVDEPVVHPSLLAAPRVVLAPHLGSATCAARTRMAELCAGAVRAALEGRRPDNLVNPEALVVRSW